jgi:hypothetical protein
MAGEPIPVTPVRKRRTSLDLDSSANPRANASSSKLDLAIDLDLVNVTVEIVREGGSQLSRVDFMKSKFTFQNYSDGTRDVGLVSQEILICDARFPPSGSETLKSHTNVFTNILQQSSGSSPVSL